MRWDIFCQVVDNYGDIGVSWRLARQLAAEHGATVRLWLDDLARLHGMCPEADPDTPSQTLAGVEIRHWPRDFPATEAADVVIEAFGCQLPESYLAAMAGRRHAPCWINLEYLSAEGWVEGCHGMASPHPRLPLTKYFFFPGFTPATGGLLRENGLAARRQAGQHAPETLWNRLQLRPPKPGEIQSSLFCYESAPVKALLHAFAASTQPVRCLVPAGHALRQAAGFFGMAGLETGDKMRHGNLTLEALPFLSQQDYDLLLWACDLNFVRGEDSFVRAQWAARPLVWQIYRQQEDAHLIKLEAFLDRYCAGLDTGAASALRAMHQSWNAADAFQCWEDFRHHHEALRAHAAAWAGQLEQQADLASKLVIFCRNKV